MILNYPNLKECDTKIVAKSQFMQIIDIVKTPDIFNV